MNIDEIIRKSISGEASEQELQHLQYWLLEDAKHEFLYQEVHQQWHIHQTVLNEHTKEKWKQFHQAMETPTIPHTGSGGIIKRFNLFRIAASITLVAMLSAGFWYMTKNNALNSEWITYTNEIGKKSEIDLSDGSKVFLSTNSKLRVPRVFEADKRNLHLEGEAFFEVAEDPQRPFTVISQNVSTTALGTSFNVIAFPDDPNVEVALASGKVDVQIAPESIDTTISVILMPGESVFYNRDSEKHLKQNFQGNRPYSWRDGVIYFDKSSAKEVVDKLKKWYDADFELDEGFDSKSSLRYKLDISNLSLEESLKEISMLVDYTFERKGKIYLVKMKN